MYSYRYWNRWLKPYWLRECSGRSELDNARSGTCKTVKHLFVTQLALAVYYLLPSRKRCSSAAASTASCSAVCAASTAFGCVFA